MSRKFIPKRPRDNGSGGISLFPFLAVLLCTMGALIMLLVVIARNVREQTGVVLAATPEVTVRVEPEVEPEPAPIPEPESDRITQEKAEEFREFIKLECEEADWFAENYALSKEEKEESLNETRERLTALEKQNLKIKEDLERLAKLAEQMDKAEKPMDPQELKKLLTAKQEQAEKIEAELKLLQAEIADGKKSYAIIPYRGTNGTFRRPIYLECEKDRVIIQPEGVILDHKDFLLENRAENPMDVALRVVRQYYMENNQVVRGTEPYPLLIVRPSGVNMYGTVQQSFGNWVQEYGYELVDEDWVMEYGEPSDELRERIEKQLRISRSRVQGYLEALEMQQNDPRNRTAFRFNSRGVAQQIGRPQVFGEETPRSTTRQGISRPTLTGQYGDRTVSGTGGDVVGQPAQAGSPNLTGQGGYPASSGGGTGYEPSSPLPPGWASTHQIQSMPPAAPIPVGDSAAESTIGGDWQPAATAPGYTQADSRGVQPNYGPTGQPYAGQPYHGQPHAGQNAATIQPNSPGQMQNPPQGQTASQAGVSGSTSSSTATETQGGMPMVDLSPQKPPQTTPERQQNWALKNVQPFSAAVTRKVKIQCEADRFVLVPQAGLTGARIVPINDSVFQATDRLVLAVWDFMESWEMASDKMYWKPVLQVTVKPGGEQRFHQLKELLKGSGLEIEAESKR